MNKSKRGRKPKSNIIVNSTPIFDNDNDTIIIKLKPPTRKNNFNFNLTKSTKNEYEFKKSICFTCNKNILSNVIGMPLKYDNKCFSTVNDFCCYDCIYNYLNNNDISEYYEIYSFLKLNDIMINNGEYPLVKEIPYNRQNKNNLKKNDIKTYKLQRKKSIKKSFFNID